MTNTRFRSHKYNGKSVTYIRFGDEYVCPGCLKVVRRVHVHHMLLKANGGRENRYNLVVICVDCHNAYHQDLEGGWDDDVALVKARLYYYMRALYGVCFELEQKGFVAKIRDLYLLRKDMFLDIDFLSVVRQWHKHVKSYSRGMYKACFDPNSKYILLDEFYGD